MTDWTPWIACDVWIGIGKTIRQRQCFLDNETVPASDVECELGYSANGDKNIEDQKYCMAAPTSCMYMYHYTQILVPIYPSRDPIS